MKQENIKKVMEQIRSKKNVANELALAAEVNVNVATMAAAQAEGGEIVERTISVPANAVELAVYSADAIGVEGNFYSDEEGWVGYYYPNQTYYYTICRVNAEEVGISEDAFEDGALWLTFSNESSGMKVFEIYNSNGDYVCDWGYEIPVAEVYNEATKQAEFMVVPSMGCTGSIIFTKSDLSITYNHEVALESIYVSTPPTKTVYLEGETFDPAGMVVTATYIDRAPSDVGNYTYTPTGALTVDDECVTIYYTEDGVTRRATQAITVNNDNTDNDNAGSEEDPVTLTGIEITTLPTKMKYVVGETFDPAGMVVKATYSDGSMEEVNNDEYTTSNSGALNLNERVMISYGGFEVDSGIRVLTEKNIPYANSISQVMDIHIPDNLADNQSVPVVITIHGGNWTYYYRIDNEEKVLDTDKTVTKEYYNYMTPFITNDTNNSSLPGCNCVHVNINYRPLYCEVTTQDGQEVEEYKIDDKHAGSYLDMLEDIQLAIKYLNDHSNTYHINPGKIALMGWSAGGHLAMLYAYQNPTQIDLVVSEAGITDFTTEEFNNLPDGMKAPVFALVGDNSNLLSQISPTTYANGNLPFTIYARGSNDTVVQVDQPISLVKELLPNYEDSLIEQDLLDNKLTDQANCAFFSFAGFGHNDFCEDDGLDGDFTDSINPRNSDLSSYYTKIKDKLTLR